MLRRVDLVGTDVSEKLSDSFIRVTIGELGATLAVTSNRRKNLKPYMSMLLFALDHYG
jgi:hypothetical protein